MPGRPLTVHEPSWAALQAAVAEGQVTDHLRAAFADGRVRFARTYEGPAVFVITVLMITKPF